ncbi:YafY family transcriptional regulator [Rhodococcus sp. HM1]|uniref:helix-turn-helix transcriptional regulator n=1 Tax=Rhodococcus sp. HM1 TaxID=2937759 RepID=UPI00200B274E|nr:YafY family protein [Rhodococcus sp. HM1]MCK8669636.1 YafY family transcriptional regulator [Rhodococcus sp. HM1]
MRSARLLEMMLRLQGSPGVTAQHLADELGVSVRTVYRDVGALSAAGVPVWTESGPGGGIRLLDGWQSRLSGLTRPESAALMLLGVPALAAELGVEVDAARTKLLGSMPLPLRTAAQVRRDRVHVDAPGWFTEPGGNEHLPIVATAVLEGRRLHIRYRRGRAEVTRTLDPLGLVAKAGIWYLVAAHSRRIVSYRVGRITAADALEEPARRPDDFDLAAWWTTSTLEFDREIRTFACTVRLSPTARRRLPKIVGAGAADVEPGEPDAEGWVRVDLMLEGEDVAVDQFLALGGGVEVLAPSSLRAALRAAGERLARLNHP